MTSLLQLLADLLELLLPLPLLAVVDSKHLLLLLLDWLVPLVVEELQYTQRLRIRRPSPINY